MNEVLIIWEERSKPLLAKNMGKNDRHFYGLVVRWQSIPICFSRESSESFLAYESYLKGWIQKGRRLLTCTPQ